MRKKQLKPVYYKGQGLVEREIAILKLICIDHTNESAGQKLELSKRTVEGYRERLLIKTGTKSTAGLVLYAVKYGYCKVRILV